MNITATSLGNVIDTLKEKFPNSLPTKVTSTEELHIKIGQQQVIRHLEELYERLTK